MILIFSGGIDNSAAGAYNRDSSKKGEDSMSRFLVSGLINLETSCRVDGFPIAYAPIDFNFFGVTSCISGVGYNVAKALHTLGGQVTLATLTGRDAAGALAVRTASEVGIDVSRMVPGLKETPASTVLFDGEGRRRIYCDLKDIQDTSYDFGGIDPSDYDAVIACNIHFSRPLLAKARQAGVPVAVDVHTLSDPRDAYNSEFMRAADILFLSDENVRSDPAAFLRTLGDIYGCRLIVMGQGGSGALLYIREEDRFCSLTAAAIGTPTNTAGAGDALFSAFVCLFCEGLPPEECLRRAEVFAAAKIRESGASNGFIPRAELESLHEAFGGSIREK